MTKYRTREQVATAQQRAIHFADNVLQDSDLADDLEAMTPEEYAEHRGLVITNPPERRTNMANGNSMTKSDLQDICDQVESILNDAYTPEASREDLAGAIGDALDVLAGNAPDDDDDDGDGDDDDSN